MIVKRCDDGYEVDVGDIGMHGNRCFYDFETERLIGVEDHTDIQEYCDDTSWTIAAGTVFDCPADAKIVLDTRCIDIEETAGTPYTGGTGGSSGTMDAGRLDGSNGTVDHDDSGSDDDSGS